MPAHRATPEDFWKYVEKTETCWIWRGVIQRTGYGCIRRLGKNVKAHRYAYELVKGKIPDGLTIDHLCRVRACVNPDHLEAVTMRVNLHRGTSPSSLNRHKRECPRGHSYDETNTRWYRGERYCRACDRDRKHRRNLAA